MFKLKIFKNTSRKCKSINVIKNYEESRKKVYKTIKKEVTQDMTEDETVAKKSFIYY